MSARAYCDLCKTYHEPHDCGALSGIRLLMESQPSIGAVLASKDERIKDLESKLGEVQKYWDDEKRRYDAADKAFRLVCDERDALQSRLDESEKARANLVQACAAYEESRAEARAERDDALSRLGTIIGAIGGACAKRHLHYLHETAEGHFCHACGVIDGLCQQTCPLDLVVEKRRDLFSELKEGLESIDDYVPDKPRICRYNSAVYVRTMAPLKKVAVNQQLPSGWPDGALKAGSRL